MGKYEEALERAKAGKPIDEVFPELKESEDERIRKEIIDFLTDGIWNSLIIDKVRQTQRYAKWIAYLEKQKDNKVVPRVLPCSAAWFEDGKELEQKEQESAEWSEEDERMIEELIGGLMWQRDITIANTDFNDWRLPGFSVTANTLINWLKSLRPQPHWKPSKEQIDALNSVILNGSFTYVGQVQDLISLKDGLKSL